MLIPTTYNAVPSIIIPTEVATSERLSDVVAASAPKNITDTPAYVVNVSPNDYLLT